MLVLLKVQFRSNPRKSEAGKHLFVPSPEGFSVVIQDFADGRGPGRIWGGAFYIGEIKNFAFFQTQKFSKKSEKSNWKFTILRKFSNLHKKNLNENWFFVIFSPIFRNLCHFIHTWGWFAGYFCRSWGSFEYFRFLGGRINHCLHQFPA